MHCFANAPYGPHATIFAPTGMSVTAICEGEVERTLHNYQCEKRIDLLVMGAYGHSRLRELLLGSTTNKMLAVTDTPVLLIH